MRGLIYGSAVGGMFGAFVGCVPAFFAPVIFAFWYNSGFLAFFLVCWAVIALLFAAGAGIGYVFDRLHDE